MVWTGSLCSKVPTRVSVILLCTSGATTLTGRRQQQQGGGTITLLLMESLSESERYLGGVHRQSNNSVLCVTSSHTAFQMAGCGYALFHFSAEPLLLWITHPTPSHPTPQCRGYSRCLPVTQTIIWPFLKEKLLFFPFESPFILVNPFQPFFYPLPFSCVENIPSTGWTDQHLAADVLLVL